MTAKRSTGSRMASNPMGKGGVFVTGTAAAALVAGAWSQSQEILKEVAAGRQDQAVLTEKVTSLGTTLTTEFGRADQRADQQEKKQDELESRLRLVEGALASMVASKK